MPEQLSIVHLPALSTPDPEIESQEIIIRSPSGKTVYHESFFRDGAGKIVRTVEMRQKAPRLLEINWVQTLLMWGYVIVLGMVAYLILNGISQLITHSFETKHAQMEVVDRA